MRMMDTCFSFYIKVLSGVFETRATVYFGIWKIMLPLQSMNELIMSARLSCVCFLNPNQNVFSAIVKNNLSKTFIV
jgi:hypothetical protein